MSNFNFITTLRHRLALAALATFVALTAIACDDFYTDSPPTPDIAQPTPANVQDGDPEVLIEESAREAMAAALGINAGDVKKILFEDETWTERNPGCYPTPNSLTGAYLIPGYRLIMQHGGVFYEYNADQGAGTGALCDSTPQTVPVEPAYSIVAPASSASPDFDTVHIIRSEEDVAEFNSTFSDTAVIGVDEIDFPAEVLVGGWVELSPNPEATRAYRTEQGTSIIIEVSVPEDTEEETGTEPSQIWALVDTTEANSTYEFTVVE